MQFTAEEIQKYETGGLSFEKTVDLFQRIVELYYCREVTIYYI